MIMMMMMMMTLMMMIMMMMMILQHRVSSIATVTVQPRMIECIANSILGPPTSVTR